MEQIRFHICLKVYFLSFFSPLHLLFLYLSPSGLIQIWIKRFKELQYFSGKNYYDN